MSNKLKFPLWVISLDIAGTLLVLAGLFGLFADGGSMFSGAIDLKPLAVPLIILGVLLMAPLVVHALKPRR